MNLEPFKFTCVDGTCPTLYRTDRGTIVVQGYLVQADVPDGEALVEVPRALLDAWRDDQGR